ncbi:exodeoxyribonuclease III, partial [candidate division GN15 bacterium]|nr:exodeoxyribonuclease III [candidate division GN15 bacterium]
GDTNIAIHDDDVANIDSWADSVLCAAPGREALQTVLDWGLFDVFREKNPIGQIYSWWDYRNLGFPRNDGLRIDHILATAPLAEKCVRAEVDRDERKGTKDDKASDHAPVIAEFDWPGR